MDPKTKKLRLSILDRRFKYHDSASTDVGRHLRAALRKQRAQEKARDEQHEVVPMRKRSAS